MKLLIACVAAMSIVCNTLAMGQDPATKPTSQEPKAPPATTNVFVIPVDCAVFANPMEQKGAGGLGAPSANLYFHVVWTQGKDYKWTASCDKKEQTANFPTGVNFDTKAVGIEVWRTSDSEQQRTFLHGEVKAAIEAAIESKIVQNKALQEAAADAIKDQQFVKNSIADAVKQLKPEITKEVLAAIKEEQATKK